jgi:chemotaxis protein MotB
MADDLFIEPDEENDAPAWMVTYSDMTTLLMVFFILIFSFSTIDLTRFRNLTTSLQRALGVVTGGEMVVPPEELPDYEVKPGGPDLKAKMNMFLENLRRFIQEQELAERAQVVMNEQGIVFTLDDLVVFASNSAQLSDNGKRVLDQLFPLLEIFPNQIEVIGHTDSQPVQRGAYADNWQLSGARALAVVKYFTGKNAHLESRLAATACGDTRPLETDTAATAQEKNRRIDIIFKRM